MPGYSNLQLSRCNRKVFFPEEGKKEGTVFQRQLGLGMSVKGSNL